MASAFDRPVSLDEIDAELRTLLDRRQALLNAIRSPISRGQATLAKAAQAVTVAAGSSAPAESIGKHVDAVAGGLARLAHLGQQHQLVEMEQNDPPGRREYDALLAQERGCKRLAENGLNDRELA